ncbi:unnamed protein product [Polarella glacialis]|uniref:Uncharacterized protein n=1 Tax=Polarella glacialis TaxID=89957 RepID=A0A813GLA7_POLGL|nr:unnamed protein product [Polarella glacialis]CAE8661341.1 unnamed protein product [Polarella glacialis]
MAGAATFVFNGKEFPLWAESQLIGVNRESLKQRAMNLRDHAGADRLPPMPRQPEELVAWILRTQDLLCGKATPPASRAGGCCCFGDLLLWFRGSQAACRGADPAHSDLTEAQSAYVDAKRASEAARLRNRGGGMADVLSQ